MAGKTVGRGVLFGNTRIREKQKGSESIGKPHDDDGIGSCEVESVTAQIEECEDDGRSVVGFGFYINICGTLSTAAATILAEPSISDDRFPGVLLRHSTDHLYKILDLEQ